MSSLWKFCTLFFVVVVNHLWATIAQAHVSFPQKVILKRRQMGGKQILSLSPRHERKAGDEMANFKKNGRLNVFLFLPSTGKQTFLQCTEKFAVLRKSDVIIQLDKLRSIYGAERWERRPGHQSCSRWEEPTFLELASIKTRKIGFVILFLLIIVRKRKLLVN